MDNDFPLLKNMNQAMRCGILTNEKGEILIIHDQPTSGAIDYVEYSPDDQSFSLIYDDGKIQNLGISFNDTIKSNIINSTEVYLAYLKNKNIVSSIKVTFLIKNY